MTIGKLYHGLKAPSGELALNQPFVVLREATRDEALACAIEMGANPKRLQKHYAYHYEISTD